ncbi:hypothetical protein [Celerinatantimonas sp. MCCC 1A17872]|uniref:hypothetical protein n=1 Tax=Celerinatantimonas sp. MCCC 1A17872 TaxID=3177514 RepID=UPI0038C299C5
MKQQVVLSLLTTAVLLPLSMLSASAAQLIHGPLSLPDDHQGQLAFYQTEQGIEAHINGLKGRKIATYGNKSKVVAVFYQDLDGDERDEVLVMLNTPKGKALYSYGWRTGYWQAITNIQPQLNQLVAQAKSFTVATLRQQLTHLPLAQYLIDYDSRTIKDEMIKKLVENKLSKTPVFSGYLNKNGKKTRSSEQAESYTLSYPVWLTKAKKYQLTAHFDRSDYATANNEQPSFMIDRVGYQDKDGNRSGSQYDYALGSPSFAAIVQVAHYKNNQLDGNYQTFSPRQGILLDSGQYVNGQQQGQWQEANGQDGYWKGQYQHGKRQGKWQLFAADDSVQLLGFANYKDGILDGDYERRRIDYQAEHSNSDTKPTIMLSKGRYQQGKKIGDWLEQENANQLKSHYLNGLKDGLQQTFSQDGTLIRKALYKDGYQQGASRYYYPNGNLKAVQTYQHGKLNGAAYRYYNTDEEHRQLQQITHYKARQSGNKWETFKNGMRISFNKDGSLYKVEHFTYNYKTDRQILFDRDGNLKRIESFQINRYRTDSENQGETLWFSAKTGKLTAKRNYEKGAPVGDSFDFNEAGAIEQHRHYCDLNTDEGCKPGHLFGDNQEFFPNGVKKCQKHFDNTALVSYLCQNQLAQKVKSRDVMLDGRLADRIYQNGQLYRETYLIAMRTKKVAGKTVPDYAHVKKDGVETVYYQGSTQSHYEILYKKGKRICFKEFNRDGQQSEKTKACQF